MAALDPATGTLADIHLPGYRTGHTELAVSGTTIANVAGGPAAPWAVLRVFPAAAGAGDSCFEIMSEQPAAGPDPAYLPDARPVQLSGGADGRVIHALVYPPGNPHAAAPDGERPPYVVFIHGGPTSNALPVREPGEGVLHQPGHRGHRRELRRLDRVRPGLPGTAARPVGHRRRGRRDARGAGAGRLRRRGRGPARHQGRLGRRLDGPRLGHERPRAHRALQGGVLGRDVLLRRRPTCGRSRSTPTTSSRGTWTG